MSLGAKRRQQAASTAADHEHIGVDENAVEIVLEDEPKGEIKLFRLFQP